MYQCVAMVMLYINVYNFLQLVNRSRVKKRHDVPLTAEMLNELNKAHLGGVDNYAMDGLYDMDAIWNEKMNDRRSMKVRLCFCCSFEIVLPYIF